MKLSSSKERGDLFSLQNDYTQVTFNLDTANIRLAAKALSTDGMCRNVNKKYLKLEAFQDNIDKEAKHAGSIFCDTLNGKMLGFPNTMTELSDIIDYKEELMALTSLDDLEITINSKSYSQETPWPEIEYSEGYLDMYEMYGRLCQKKRYLGLCLPYGMHINQKRNSAIL